MQGSTKSMDSSKVLVLDTAAFLAAIPLQLYNTTLYTVPAVIDEVKDYESRARLELASLVGRFHIEVPEERYLRKAMEIAKELRVLEKLSIADLQVLALSLKLVDSGVKPIVLTDDYVLQRVLKSIGIEFRTVKTIGIGMP